MLRVLIEYAVPIALPSLLYLAWLAYENRRIARGGEGVLRRAVPAWLSTAPFRPLVSSHDHAARSHGGAGALYVRLRRHSPRAP